MTRNQLTYTLNKLVERGLIMTGNYNDNPFNRTLWYALTDDGLRLFKDADQDESTSENSEISFLKNPKCSLYSTDNTPDIYRAGKPPRAPKFIPPTVDEVRAYCTERGNAVDPEAFVDYYTANGWTQGRGKPIRDWRACVRTWEKRDAERKASHTATAPQYERLT